MSGLRIVFGFAAFVAIWVAVQPLSVLFTHFKVGYLHGVASIAAALLVAAGVVNHQWNIFIRTSLVLSPAWLFGLLFLLGVIWSKIGGSQ